MNADNTKLINNNKNNNKKKKQDPARWARRRWLGLPLFPHLYFFLSPLFRYFTSWHAK